MLANSGHCSASALNLIAMNNKYMPLHTKRQSDFSCDVGEQCAVLVLAFCLYEHQVHVTFHDANQTFFAMLANSGQCSASVRNLIAMNNKYMLLPTTPIRLFLRCWQTVRSASASVLSIWTPSTCYSPRRQSDCFCDVGKQWAVRC